jgi:soluble lytic murein transglycosylase-like protein
MTAFECAATGQQACATEAVESEVNRVSASVQQRRQGGRGAQGVGAVLALISSDVLDGVRRVSHNALAMLGLAAVAVVVFLMGRADVRSTVETQALGWLMERANLRATASAPAVEEQNNEVLLAMAEPDAIQRATATNPAELNRQQANVAYWIARRYNVAPEPISRLVQEAWDVGHRVGMEPTLVLAVMAIESGFNPFAQSHVGAQGLMQVMTRIHHDKYEIFGGQNAAFDPVTNLRVGVQVLKDCIRKAGSLEGGLKYYVGAANLVDDGGYAAKVLAEQAYLRQVAGGAKLPVNAPLPQAVVSAQASVPATAVVPSQPGAAQAKPDATQPVAPAASDSAPAPAVPSHRPEQVALLNLGQ